MAQLGNVEIIRTDKDVHFTGAIAQNAQEQENIALPESIAAGRHCRARLKWINVISDQQLAWEIWLWSDRNQNAGSDMDANNILGRWEFNTSDGKQIAGAGPYYYYIDGLDVAYQDTDGGLGVIHSVPQRVHAGGELHVALVNRSATGKNAGATGEIVIIFGFEPTVGW